MVEGIANYLGTEVWGDWQSRYDTYSDYFSRQVAPLLRNHEIPWPDRVEYLGAPNRVISQRAVAHLISIIGEKKFLEVLGQAPRRSGDARWTDRQTGNFSIDLWERRDEIAFEDAFGISLVQFYESFESMRSDLGENTTASGVLRRDPTSETAITLGSVHRLGGFAGRGKVDNEGRFEIAFLAGPGDYVNHSV